MSELEALAFKKSNCTPRTPPRVEVNKFNEDVVVPPQFCLPPTPGQKRQREDGTPPELKPAGKKINMATANTLEQNNGSCWGATSFAEVLKGTNDLQVAIRTEPARQFSPEERLDFIDAMGDTIFCDPGCVPRFESTSIRGNFLIINAVDDFSFQWILSNASKMSIWPECSLIAIPAKDIPRLVKGLLWLPGRKPIPSQELLLRLGKLNPTLLCEKWRVFSRKNESHGVRVLVGFEESGLAALKEVDMKPFWSTVRGQVTLVAEMRTRRRKRGSTRAPQGTQEPYSQDPPNTDTSVPTVITPLVNNTVGDIAIDSSTTRSTSVVQVDKGDFHSSVINDSISVVGDETSRCTEEATTSKPKKKGSKGKAQKITSFLKSKSLETSALSEPGKKTNMKSLFQKSTPPTSPMSGGSIGVVGPESASYFKRSQNKNN